MWLSDRKPIRNLNVLASTGNYSRPALDKIITTKNILKSTPVSYYLASLYLDLGEVEQAIELLSAHKKPGRELKKYYGLLSLCRKQNLALPVLSKKQHACLDYLDTAYLPTPYVVESKITTLIEKTGGFSVLGNAPGNGKMGIESSYCRFCFNNYHLNSRISDAADVYVATPSMSMKPERPSELLFITGNNIFHRRSSVWEKFIDNQSYRHIMTFPRALWARLYNELEAPPSAGLLTLAYLAEILSRSKQLSDLNGLIAGFSNEAEQINHSYDNTPASSRHNWSGEILLRQELITRLSACCTTLEVIE